MGKAGALLIGLIVLLPAAALAGFQDQASDPKPDLCPSLTSTPLLTPNQDIKITVTVLNKGAAPAPESDFDIIIRNGHAPREVVRTFKRTIRALDPADSFSYTFSIKVSLGLIEICGTSDRRKKVPDADRKNNTACIMIEGK